MAPISELVKVKLKGLSLARTIGPSEASWGSSLVETSLCEEPQKSQSVVLIAPISRIVKAKLKGLSLARTIGPSEASWGSSLVEISLCGEPPEHQ
jgi:hypothetical protein